MQEPIGPTPPRPYQTSTQADLPALSKQLQDQVSVLTQQLQQVLEDASLSQQSTFLQQMTENAKHLDKTVQKTLTI